MSEELIFNNRDIGKTYIRAGGCWLFDGHVSNVFGITSSKGIPTLSRLVGVNDGGRHVVGKIAEDDSRNKWSV